MLRVMGSGTIGKNGQATGWAKLRQPSHRHRYYRLAQFASFRASHEAVGVNLTCLKIVRYSVSRDEIAFRLIWD